MPQQLRNPARVFPERAEREAPLFRTEHLAQLLRAQVRRADRIAVIRKARPLDRGLRRLALVEPYPFARELLREPVKDMPLDESSAWHIDLTGSGSEEDTHLYLKYYADEETRRRWSADFPDDEMPEHAEPPFDRDRYLPQVDGVAQTDAEGGEVM